MKILITGARSYVAYYWGLALRNDHEIHFADSLAHPFCRYTSFAEQYHRVAPPATDAIGFAHDLRKIIRTNEIDLVIPTCEEIFYVSAMSETLGCEAFCPEHDLLAKLHHKLDFYNLLPTGVGIRFPETSLITHPSQVKSINSTVLKPVFSRFGCNVITHPENADLSGVGSKGPWVQQEKLEGRALCSYAVAIQGKMVAFSCYHARYRMKNSAALGIAAVSYKAIEAFNAEFIRDQQFTGQIAFDFIEDEVKGGIYVIECNPRGTSGIHLLNLDQLGAAMLGSEATVDVYSHLAVFKPHLRLYHWLGLVEGGCHRGMHDEIRQAHDILQPPGAKSPSCKRWLLGVELMMRMVRHKCSLAQSTTLDIEWNGQEIAIGKPPVDTIKKNFRLSYLADPQSPKSFVSA